MLRYYSKTLLLMFIENSVSFQGTYIFKNVPGHLPQLHTVPTDWGGIIAIDVVLVCR